MAEGSVLIRVSHRSTFGKYLPRLVVMLFYWLLFFFLAMGAKVLLAFVMIYLLLPADRMCNHCDEETLLIQPRKFGRVAMVLSMNRLEWRWCPRCEWEGLARGHGRKSRHTIRIRQDTVADAPILPES